MRLLSLTQSDYGLQASEFPDSDTPPYTILSHTWGNESDEVTYQDITNYTGNSKAGYRKLSFLKEKSISQNFAYAWADTCCINKSDNAELQHSLNSMFHWYQRSARCYIYLQDVTNSDEGWEDSFRKSRWFARGWTLQELIAPRSVEFFSQDGNRLGDKKSLENLIHEITGISLKALQGQPLSEFTKLELLSWTNGRETKIKEDEVYSLLGMFGVTMAMNYGEGTRNAYRRLFEQVAKVASRERTATSPQGKRFLLFCLPRNPLTNIHSAILYYAKKNSVQLVEALIEDGIATDATDSEGNTALMHACKIGNKSLVKVLCQGYNTGINRQNRIGNTALIQAVIEGRLEVVSELLSYSPNLEIKNHDRNWSPLFWALHQAYGIPQANPPVSPHWAIAESLLHAGADAETVDVNSNQPLHWFCEIGKHTAVDWLLARSDNVNVNVKKKGGWTPLIQCAVTKDEESALLTMESLLDAQADIELHLDGQGYTALCQAARLGHFDQVKLLVKRGANVNVMGCTGWTPLAEAAYNNYLPRISTYLLDHGAFINHRMKGDLTPLHLACMASTRNPESVQLLIDRGANLSAETSEGMTVLDEACTRNYFEVVRVLVKAIFKARLSLNKGNRISTKYRGWTSLMRAAELGHLESCKVLVEEGHADVGVKTPQGETAEQLARTHFRVREYLAYKS